MDLGWPSPSSDPVSRSKAQTDPGTEVGRQGFVAPPRLLGLIGFFLFLDLFLFWNVRRSCFPNGGCGRQSFGDQSAEEDQRGNHEVPHGLSTLRYLGRSSSGHNGQTSLAQSAVGC
jgi:hypothetical protein